MIALLLQGIPEVTAVVTLAFVIARIPLNWKRIVILGIALAFISYVIRLFTIPFGIHTILQIILLLIALTWLGKVDFSLSLIASILSVLALGIIEFVCLSFLMSVFGVTPEILFADPIKRIIIGEPIVFFLFISSFILNKLLQKRGEINEFH